KPENRDRDLCRELRAVPGLPSGGPVPTGVPTALPSALPTALPSIPGLPPIPGLPDGARRAGTEPRPAPRPVRQRATVAELSKRFDPTLVRLLVPGLVGPRTTPGKG